MDLHEDTTAVLDCEVVGPRGRWISTYGHLECTRQMCTVQGRKVLVWRHLIEHKEACIDLLICYPSFEEVAGSTERFRWDWS